MKTDNDMKLRQLVRRLINDRRQQKKQIDILCNDIIAAHSEFIEHLKDFRFSTDFLDTMLTATSNLETISSAAGGFLTANIKDAGIGIALTTQSNPIVNFYSNDASLQDIPAVLGKYITTKFIEAVCHSGKVCLADELCKLEFFAGPAVLKRLSLAAIGLNDSGPAVGMLLLYRSADVPLSQSEIKRVVSVRNSLCRSVGAALGNTCDSFA